MAKGGTRPVMALRKPDGSYAEGEKKRVSLLLGTHLLGSKQTDLQEATTAHGMGNKHFPAIYITGSGWDFLRTPAERAGRNNTSFKYNEKQFGVGIHTQKLEKGKSHLHTKIGKEDGTNSKSFRPISLIPFLLKTMEKVIDNHIRMEVMEEATLHQSQHVYRAGRSTETALLELTGTIQKTLDEGETAICAFLDISGAFDNTSHEAVRQLLEKRGNLVVHELLYRLTAFGVHCIGYADDITIIAKGKIEGILCELIQMSLRITNEWCHSVGLSINSSKATIVPFIGKRKISNMKHIRSDGTFIEYKSEFKYLGITLDKKLLWNRHIALTTNKATRTLMICRNLAEGHATYGQEYP
ncbi:hypothetical protein Trydic_g7853 [Trypoxylus dichotomus]